MDWEEKGWKCRDAYFVVFLYENHYGTVELRQKHKNHLLATLNMSVFCPRSAELLTDIAIFSQEQRQRP